MKTAILILAALMLSACQPNLYLGLWSLAKEVPGVVVAIDEEISEGESGD